MAVLLQTTEGELTVDLFAEDAPYSAYNFLKLCKAKYYNNVAFHRVEKNYLASAGAPLTADARWNVAGLGGVSTHFMKLGKAETLVETGKTNAEYVERCGGCSFWGVETLAAEKRVSLRLSRRPLPGASLPLSVKTEDPGTKETTEDKLSIKKEVSNFSGNVLHSSSSLTTSQERAQVTTSSTTDTGDNPALPARHNSNFSNDNPSSASSSSSSNFSSSTSSSSSSSQTCMTSSTVSARKSTTRKSGWDDSSSFSSQQTSYFSSLDFSRISFPPFPSSVAIPNASSSRSRHPLRMPASARFCPAEPSSTKDTRRRHQQKGMIGWIPTTVSGNAIGSMLEQKHLTPLEQQKRLHGEASSLFYVTLRENIDFLDKRSLTLFGYVTEGLEVLEKINQTFVDDRFVPLTPVRILHTYVLDDPFDDPPLLLPPPNSPLPLVEEVLSDEEDVQDEVLLLEKVEKKEAEARKVTLEILGDLPSADAKPPENVLFVAQLNPVTEDDDLRTVFARFGEILSCDVIRDWKTKQSLQYAFITFAERSACELAYFKMQNVLIDDRRIHVDFSQSVARTWQQYKQSGRYMQQQSQQQQQGNSCRLAGSANVGGSDSTSIQTTRHQSTNTAAHVAAAAARATAAAAAARGAGAAATVAVAAAGKEGHQQGWDTARPVTAGSHTQHQVKQETKRRREGFTCELRNDNDSGRNVRERENVYSSRSADIEEGRTSRAKDGWRDTNDWRARDKMSRASSRKDDRYDFIGERERGAEAVLTTTARRPREEDERDVEARFSLRGREREKADGATRDHDRAARSGRRAATERSRTYSSDESSKRSRSNEVKRRRRERSSTPREDRRPRKKTKRKRSSISSRSDSEISDKRRKNTERGDRNEKHAKKSKKKDLSKKHRH